jgi:hypothetical protein
MIYDYAEQDGKHLAVDRGKTSQKLSASCHFFNTLLTVYTGSGCLVLIKYLD